MIALRRQNPIGGKSEPLVYVHDNMFTRCVAIRPHEHTHTESSSIWHRNLYDTMPFLHKEGRALSLSVPTIIRPLDTSHSGLYHGQSNQRTMEAPQYNSVGGWRSATGSEQCGCTCVVCSFYSHLTRGRESTFTTSQGSRGTWPTDWLGAERSLGWKLMAGQGQGQACDREGRPLWTASHSHCGLLWPLLGGTQKALSLREIFGCPGWKSYPCGHVKIMTF